MVWEIEYTDEFGAWWDALTDAERASLDAGVTLLETYGTNLRFPHSSSINASKHGHMRELRVQHAGHPYRVLYAFDPRRCAILLLGADKTGNDRWYLEEIPTADRLYDEHLESLRREGLIDG